MAMLSPQSSQPSTISRGLLNLPAELILDIASGLDRFALLALSQVCRTLLHFSLSSSWYWHSDYVPAFLPVIAPIADITAVQFREAAIRSLRTRHILINHSPASASNADQKYIRKRASKANEPELFDRKLQQTIGSRFLFQIEQTEILFWDACTGRKVPPIAQLFQSSPPVNPNLCNVYYNGFSFKCISPPSSSPLKPSSSKISSNPTSALVWNTSPFAGSMPLDQVGDILWCDGVASLCVSTDQLRIAICWGIHRQGRECEGFLERVTVTFRTRKSIRNDNLSQTNQAHIHRAGGNSDGDSGQNGEEEEGGENDDDLYAEYQWHDALPVYHFELTGPPSYLLNRFCRMTERYVILCLAFHSDDNIYVRVYDWGNPLQPSYIYCEKHPSLLSDVICTPHHLAFISTHMIEDRNTENSIYIRPIPLLKWFSDSNIALGAKASTEVGYLEEGWVNEESEEGKTRFPGTIGRMNIKEELKEDYEENTLSLPIHYSHHNNFCAIGSTDTSRFDSSTFVIFICSPSITIVRAPGLEYYIVSIARKQPSKVIKQARRDAGDPEDAVDIGRDYIHVVKHGCPSPKLTALSTNEANDSDDTAGEDNGKSKSTRTTPLNGHNGPYTFICHLQDKNKLRKGKGLLISSGRSINCNEHPRGFDAHTGIVVVKREMGNEIFWYA